MYIYINITDDILSTIVEHIEIFIEHVVWMLILHPGK